MHLRVWGFRLWPYVGGGGPSISFMKTGIVTAETRVNLLFVADNVSDEDDDDAMRTCVAGKRKVLYCLPQSQNNCTKIFSLIRNSVTRGEVQLGGLRLSGPPMYHVDHPYPPPHMVDHLICGDSYIYRMLRNNSSVHM